MTTQQLDRWAERLASGEVEPANIAPLASVPFEELLERVSAGFPHRLLDRRLRSRHEVGIARKHRQIASSVLGGAMTHHFSTCLFLNGENGQLTGLTILAKVRCRPTTDQKFEIVSSAGRSVVDSPDGWVLATLPERTVILDENLLLRRGWQLKAA